ncbi:transposable element Tc1 transposase [Trichonephila clavipes]|nr:transposable element Tc1 transposase [Trichonephila clavipes]
MSKFLLHCDLGYLPTTEKNDSRRIRAHYEKMSEFEREDKARPHAARACCYELSYSLSNTSLASQRSPNLSSIEHVWDMIGRRLQLPGNADDLSQRLEQIWQEIPQKTTRVLYHSMPRRVAACIQAGDGPTPYCARYFVAMQF